MDLELDYKVSNTNAIYKTDDTLEEFVRTFYATPGQDATHEMRFKTKIKNLGDLGFFVDLCIRSSVVTVLLSNFEKDIVGQRVLALDYFRSNSDLSFVSRQCIDSWAKSEWGTKQFLKYITDTRSATMYHWLTIFFMRPTSIIKNSLHNLDWLTQMFKRQGYEEQPSIFGMKG
jgi:hypothetical protein